MSAVKKAVLDVYNKYRNVGLSTAFTAASWETFRRLNNYLFPNREVAYEALGIKGKTFLDFILNLNSLKPESIPALAYFEVGRATFQGGMALMGNEFVKLLYDTRFGKATEKVFGKKGSLRQKAMSMAAGGAAIGVARLALAAKYIFLDKMDPGFVFTYLVEPWQTIPEEIARSLIYGPLFLYTANKINRHFKKTDSKTSENEKV